MTLLNKKIKEDVQKIFQILERDVAVKFFTQESECQFCRETHDLLQELCALTPRLKLQVYDLVKQAEVAKSYGIDKIPAIVLMDEKDYGIRFYGIPSGYEFGSFLEGIRLISSGKVAMADETKKFLLALDQDVHLQVFVTPTCPYCPPAVTLAHQFAYVAPRLRADMVEAVEFPHLAQKYQVMGVPRTVINETEFLEGAAPEQILVEKIRAALLKKSV